MATQLVKEELKRLGHAGSEGGIVIKTKDMKIENSC